MGFALNLFTTFTIFAILNVTIAVYNTEVTHVVQRAGRPSTFSCQVPREDSWSSCTFRHHDGSQGQCSVLNQPQQNFQTCGAFGSGAEIHVQDDTCQLVLNSVNNEHNGTWSCDFEQAMQRLGRENALKQTEYPEYYGSIGKEFTLTLLHEPTDIEAHPKENTNNNYSLMEWFQSMITIRNVSPRPRVQWTMNNKSIDGLFIVDTEVNYMYQDMEVVERIQFSGKESMDGKHLQYRLTLDTVDEFGNAEEDFVKLGQIKLNCNNCDRAPTTSSTSSASTTTNLTTLSSTTTTKTTETTTTYQTTTKLTTLSSTTTTTTTETTTTETTTTMSTTPQAALSTTTTITTSTNPSTTTTPSPVDCSFNMTDLSGPLNFPKPGTICNLEPSPSWTILISCDGNCINVINLNLNNLNHNSTDPCQTQLRISSSSYNETLCFNAATPMEITFNKGEQVRLELENFSEDSPVSFDGEYYFSE